MLPFRSKSSVEELDSSNATANTAHKQTTAVTPSIRNEDPVSLDDETSSQPAVAATEIVPIADHETPSIAPSEAVPSSCGETFSSFTEGTLRSYWTAPPPRPLLPFKNFILYDDAIRTLPLNIDGHPKVSGSRAPPPCPLPWLYEFSWADGAIHFGGNPLNTAQARSRPSELGNATFGRSMQRSATLLTDVATCKSAAEVTVTCKSAAEVTVTCKSEDSVNLRRIVFERGEIQKEIAEQRAYLLKQLEAYWRSHPPRRSANRQKGKGPANQAEQRPSTRAVSRPYSRRGFAGGRRKIGQGSGDGDEDDDDNDDLIPASNSSMPKAQIRWYACPYQKWKPQHFLLECGAGFQRITDVKTHLLKKHFAITCPLCRDVYDGEYMLQLHLSRGCDNPPISRPDGCLMSDGQRAAIKTHFGGKKMLHHEQWAFLFRTLFPTSPFPTSIYLLPKQEEHRNFLQTWVLSAGRGALNDIHHHTLLDMPNLNQNEPKERQLGAVMAQFITLRLLEDLSEERLCADFAVAQQAFAMSSSSAGCVSAVANHQALTAPTPAAGSILAHDAVAQLPTSEWNPQHEPNQVPWPMLTVGEHTGILGSLNTNFDALDPTSACYYGSNLSKLSSGFGENTGINIGGPGIPGVDLLGPSLVPQWAGGYQQDEFMYPDSSYLTNGAAPGPSASAIVGVGVDGYTRPLTAWNPLGQGEDWYFTGNSFHPGFGSSLMVDGGMISGWRVGGLQPISEMPELKIQRHTAGSHHGRS
ncbi:hypothetical protein B0T25DRAFT_185664 [Lasiosphaeria hispida]|uniref:C2H2-type domain-containing protein n=1 Tax=Lasiosphaeria hispida TaxID=260671 RepID=A0AAJ0HGX6_9PEZI|nr:hypothetical protein B0T25DRAFT_185664 [Lasiosphaeria hispida]